MDRQFENSNHKREHDEDNSDQNKRKNLEVPEEADATTNLIDVIDDCLVYIFKRLTLRDLFNVSNTCKRLKAVAQLTFEVKYRVKVAKLYPAHSNRFDPIKFSGNTIVVSHFASCLKVLRHFGVKIPELCIDYYHLREDKEASMGWYMNEYCTDSLIDLKMDYAMNEVTANWTKPFTNVESIELWRCDLGEISAWFPNLRRLKLVGSRLYIMNIFPHLRDLEIENIDQCGCDRSSITEMLRLNQHLEILRLSCNNCDMKFLKSISGYIQNIKILGIKCDSGFFNLEGDSIHLKGVKELHINLRRFDSLPKIPFTFDQLETVKLTVEKFKLNDNFKDFIRKNSSLNKLLICVWADTLDSASIEQIKSDFDEVSSSLVVEII